MCCSITRSRDGKDEDDELLLIWVYSRSLLCSRVHKMLKQRFLILPPELPQRPILTSGFDLGFALRRAGCLCTNIVVELQVGAARQLEDRLGCAGCL
jgi:hypothetical protein